MGTILLRSDEVRYFVMSLVEYGVEDYIVLDSGSSGFVAIENSDNTWKFDTSLPDWMYCDVLFWCQVSTLPHLSPLRPLSYKMPGLVGSLHRVISSR